MYTVWVTSYYADIFPYRTPLSHSAFSMYKSTVTTDTTDTTHVHNYDKSIISCVQEISLIVKAALHSCNTCLDNL